MHLGVASIKQLRLLDEHIYLFLHGLLSELLQLNHLLLHVRYLASHLQISQYVSQAYTTNSKKVPSLCTCVCYIEKSSLCPLFKMSAMNRLSSIFFQIERSLFEIKSRKEKNQGQYIVTIKSTLVGWEGPYSVPLSIFLPSCLQRLVYYNAKFSGSNIFGS